MLPTMKHSLWSVGGSEEFQVLHKRIVIYKNLFVSVKWILKKKTLRVFVFERTTRDCNCSLEECCPSSQTESSLYSTNHHRQYYNENYIN